MNEIFNYIDYNDIIHIDNYNNPLLLFKLNNIKFRSFNSQYLNFQVQLGINSENKIISITNKQFSFLIQKLNHFLGHEYANELKKNYEVLKSEEKTSDILIVEENVFQFFDYESVSGTGHSYDLMFYLLCIYKINNLTAKLMVMESDNKYYNNLLNLIKTYFNVEYFYIKPNKTYLFKNFTCVRTYQNILFDYVKKFINNHLIEPIMNKYEKLNEPYYDDIIRIKYENKNNINRTQMSFKKTDLFKDFCKNKNIFDLNDIDDNEELKIYLLNKAKIIRINWGSAYYININYYLKNTDNKTLSIIFHSNIMSERNFLNQQNDLFMQNLPLEYCDNILNNYYNDFNFKGEIIDNITDIDNYVLRTII
jgi:hypothetical protein